jgi:hypothetical protein
MPGNLVIAQEPHLFTRAWVEAGTATWVFDPGTSADLQWFQCPVPNSYGLVNWWFDGFALLFRSTGSVYLSRVDLYDGEHKFVQVPVDWRGDHAAGVEVDQNLVTLDENQRHDMTLCLNASVAVQPGPQGGQLSVVAYYAEFGWPH